MSRTRALETSQFCDATAVSRGIPGCTVESGYLGSRDEASIERVVAGVRHLWMPSR